MFDVCVVGSANLDLVANVESLPAPGETVLALGYGEHPGGKGLNQAVAAARLGARVAFAGCVGDDDAGERLRAVMTSEGIDTSAVAVLAGTPTGRALIDVDASAENSIVVVPGANARTTEALATVVLPPARVVLAQLEVPLDTVERAFRHGRSIGAVNVLNPAPSRPLPDELLSLVDVIVPNEGESLALGGTDLLHGIGIGTVVVTLGARGARVSTPAGEFDVPAFRVAPVDTTAAGDAFIGALCAGLAAGDEIRLAVRRAAAAGALATTVAGAVPSLPTGESVGALLAEQG